MESFINALSTGPLSVSVLMMLVLLLVGFYVVYVIPKLKSSEEERKVFEERLNKIQHLEKELAEANTVIKNFVEDNALNESLSRSMGEVLSVCRETYQVVAQQFSSTEDDIEDVRRKLNQAIEVISNMDRNQGIQHSDKFNKVDNDLRFLSQQLMNIHQRLAGIMGLMVGGPAKSMDHLFGVEERDLK